MTYTKLPDGSAFCVGSFELPKDHWIYAPRTEGWDSDRDTSPDTPYPIFTHVLAPEIEAAIKYAIRAATMCGQDMDFDPDALVQNTVYALCGPFSKLKATS